MTVSDDVVEALGLVLEEFARSRDELKKQARDAVASDDFAEARRSLEQVEQLDALADDVRGVIAGWEALGLARPHGVAELDADVDTDSGSRTYLGRVGRGLRTSEEVFRIPILRALVEFGGTADISEVIDHVGVQLANVLKPADLEGLKSDADMIRWRNTAQWTRNELVKRGLMEPSRERGVWEISTEGRTWLAQNGDT